MPKPDEGPRYRLLGVMPREIEGRPKQEPDDTVFTWPHLLVRHAVVAGATIGVVFLLAILFNAPLKDMANPNLTPPVAKAPWYFDGLQELLSHFQPMVAGVLVPVCLVAFLVGLPYLDRSDRESNRRFIVIVVSVVFATAVVLTVIGAFFRGPEWSWVWPWHHLYLEL